MWAEKKRHKRRQKMSYRYAENQASTRERMFKEGGSGAKRCQYYSFQFEEEVEDECLLDLTTFCGVLWSEADSRVAE